MSQIIIVYRMHPDSMKAITEDINREIKRERCSEIKSTFYALWRKAMAKAFMDPIESWQA